MSAEKRLEELFAQALEQKTPVEREKLLAQASKDQPELRSQVESLLRAHEQAGDFLSQTIQLPSSDFEPEPLGSLIGRYKLLEKLGEGGFGIVYMAEQQEPVHRKVALKIIKAGMDTREVIARFEAERQALALMDHPNIARVLDGGTTEAKRPYFVMELVRGIPITDYCDQVNLSASERLELFIKVCQAVQHAHQKAVIHRDLKPSNILVTLHDSEPVPKVIDFGVAKALGQKLTEKTLFTSFRQMIGTPAYMAPEQAQMSGLDIDTRSDIYSLGVLLYELLTGVTPFDKETLAKAALDEIRRMIRETEPPKPSTRLRTLGDKLPDVATRRRCEPRELSRLVRGEMDWIVMKCLEKDRTRRYETANGLASDIKRFLNNEPVTAAAPGTFYRAQKFISRHKSGLAVASAFLLLSLAAAVLSTLEAVRATRAERTQSQLRNAAESAQKQEATQRQKAAAAAQESLSRLVTLNVANGARLLDQGDSLGSLPWFSEAFKLDLRTGNADWVHRLRLGMILRQCPRPVQMWFHTDRVNAAAFSPDGRWVLTASQDKTARVWDVETGLPVIPPMVHAAEVQNASFMSDGKLVLSLASDGALLWRPDTGEVRHRFPHPAASCAASDPNGPLVATAGHDGSVRLWDAVNGHAVVSPIHHTTSVSQLAFSPDGRLLAIGASDEAGQLWDVTRWKQLCDFRVGDSLRSLAFNPAGTLLAAADWANSVFVWKVTTCELASPILRHGQMVAHVTFSPDGQLLASSSNDGTTKLWDSGSGALVGSMSHSGYPLEARFSQDSRLLLSRQLDGWLEVWNVPSGKLALRIRHSGWVTAADLHPDGRHLLTGCYDGGVRVWELRPEGASFSPWSDGHRRIVGVSSDGRYLITQERASAVQVWDTVSWRPTGFSTSASGRILAAFLSEDAKRLMFVEPGSGGDGSPGTFQRLVLCDSETAGAVRDFSIGPPAGLDAPSIFAASRDLQRLAVGRGKVLELWDVSTGKLLGEPRTHATQIRVLEFSQDGARLLLNCGQWLHVIDSVTGTPVLPHLTNNLATGAGRFSPNGKLVAGAGSDSSYDPGQARIWDLATGKLLREFTHKDGVQSVAFSADSHWLATGSEDRTARVWDVRTGEPVTPNLPHSGFVISLAFSPDSRLLASVGGEGLVHVWDTMTGEPVTTPLAEGRGVSEVRFLSSSRYLLAHSGDSFQLLELEPASLAAEDLMGLAQLFSNHRVDKTGALEPLPVDVQKNLSALLHARAPQNFRAADNLALFGHETDKSQPDHAHIAALRRRNLDSLLTVPARARDTSSNLVDLTAYYNASLVGNWHADAKDNDLVSLSTGVQNFAGIEFDVRGLIQFGSRQPEGPAFSPVIKGIPLNRHCRRVHFLHSTIWGFDPDGTRIGRYVLHYSDGSQGELPLVLGEDVLDWWVKPKQDQTNRLVVAWSGTNGKSRAEGKTIQLYKTTWENPQPDLVVQDLDFIPDFKRAAPFLIAVTVEP